MFLPLRAGSQRVPRKNTRPFLADGRSLFQLKLEQLSALSDRVAEIVISTDDDEVIEQFQSAARPANMRISQRPGELALSTTRLPDLIAHVPSITNGDWIMWTHVTSPFLDTAQMHEVFDLLETEVWSGAWDSMMSVNELRQFLWSEVQGRLINVDPQVNAWPSTQDLEPLYEVNSGFFIAHRSQYVDRTDRIGKRPYLYLCDRFSGMDIDWQEDFDLARAMVPLVEVFRKRNG